MYSWFALGGNIVRSTITDVKARQVLDSKGRPVVEVDIITSDGTIGRAGASTGTSVGANESYVLRDNNPNQYGGLGVTKAIENVSQKIRPALIGMDCTNQEAIDNKMIELDGTQYLSHLGGNAVYACSIAAARAGALCKGIPLYKHLALGEIKTIFAPAYNMINGGTYAGKTLPIQECLVIPRNIDSFSDGVRICVEIFMKLGEVIRKHQGGCAPMMGNYCGYGAPSDDVFELFGLITEAVDALNYRDYCWFSMDCAASEFYNEKENAYLYRGRLISRDELIKIYADLVKQFPIGFIEDALYEEDFEGFTIASNTIDAILIGDDFLCTNLERIKKAVKMHAIKGMIMKPNQVGTITKALEAVKYMQKNNMLVVGSGRAGGVIDDPVAEIAVAVGAPIMKTGAPRSGERTIFTNFGLRMEEELGGTLKIANIKNIPGFIRQHDNW